MAKSPQTMLQEQFKNLFNNQMLAANSVGTNKIFEFKFGDIIMHGVNDTMSFAKILTREFPAILKQELGRGLVLYCELRFFNPFPCIEAASQNS